MNREDLGRQLSENVEVKTSVHQAWLKRELERQEYFQTAQKKAVQRRFDFLFMNIKKLVPVIGMAVVLVLIVTVSWNFIAPFFPQHPGVADAQAQGLVDSALKKIQRVNSLSPEEERQALRRRIESGLRSAEDTQTDLNITANSMFKTIYTEEQMINALKRINRDMESALKEARSARDLSIVTADPNYQSINEDEKLHQRVQDVVCSYGSFKVQNFRYRNNFDYAGGQITHRTPQANRCDDVKISDVFTQSSSYPLFDLFANEEGNKRPIILRYTDREGRITFLVMSSQDGLPLSLIKPLLTNNQTTEVMKANARFFKERMGERFTTEWSLTSDTITPEKAQKKLVELRLGVCQPPRATDAIPLQWNFIGTDAGKVQVAQETFDFSYFSKRAAKVARYYHDPAGLSVNNCSGKYIVYTWYDKENNPLLVAVRQQVEF